MFVSEGLSVAVPFALARERLQLGLISGFVADSSSDAYKQGTMLLARLGPFKDQPRLAKQVRIKTLPPYSRGDALVIPLRWIPVGPRSGPFPEFDGNLELSPDGPQNSRLTLVGSYRPPLGALGERLDRLVLHRAAYATICSLLDRLVTGLVEPHGTSRSSQSAPTRPPAD
jgi:hypothetical protein